MDFDAFLDLPKSEMSKIIRENGLKVCVFPINGTRRWLMIEYPNQTKEDFIRAIFGYCWTQNG